MNQEDLWRSFPTTATEFEAMFPDEEACRRYFMDLEGTIDKSVEKRCQRSSRLFEVGCC